MLHLLSLHRAENVQLDTTLPISAEMFARLARSQEFYRSTRAETKLSKQQVMELGDWVVWEFQNEDEEAPRSSRNSEEVVPYPPLDRIRPVCLGLEGGGLQGRPGSHPSATTGQGAQQTAVVADTKMQMVRNLRRIYAAASSPTHSPPQPDGAGAQTAVSVAHNMFSNVVARRPGPFLRPHRHQQQQQQQQRQSEPQQMYRKVRLKYAVSSPIGSSQNEGAQGHTLREGEDEVTYTETDCISGLPMFRGNLVVKTTFRVTRSEHDPENSVRVKVCVVVGDVKLSRAIAWLSKGVKYAIRDSGTKQAAKTLQDMVEAKSKAWL
ncbi:hypothetical protein Esi_0107_0003 [Ectocarpus siliculosus]|uniref:Uncharacterized protein n=1 Tax=Ectocarpus siliculosus TaxID=2880 RepID=D7FHA9_ECTSI|nr:hypothetical protein Esi_0107_0003 [Ectocarpus siliculosus]|eukprot:CBJ28476.1 hypothetical protein Esi_0107_0003 [Ectocarpus siliculosus]